MHISLRRIGTPQHVRSLVDDPEKISYPYTLLNNNTFSSIMGDGD